MIGGNGEGVLGQQVNERIALVAHARIGFDATRKLRGAGFDLVDGAALDPAQWQHDEPRSEQRQHGHKEHAGDDEHFRFEARADGEGDTHNGNSEGGCSQRSGTPRHPHALQTGAEVGKVAFESGGCAAGVFQAHDDALPASGSRSCR